LVEIRIRAKEERRRGNQGNNQTKKKGRKTKE
jgi:hypothetical protein